MPAISADTPPAVTQPETPDGSTGFSVQAAICPLIIVIAVLAVYLPGLGNSFILNWDDNKYVVENATAHGFSLAHIKAAFANSYFANYAPLHIISYMLDYTLWGLNPAGYRLGNILLHAANGSLFYYLLRRMAWLRTPALLAALLFVLHPVQVESVTWISQRKNVLAMFFALLSFIGYLHTRNARQPEYRAYIFSLVTFTLALLTKSVTVFLPVAFILYDIMIRQDRDLRGIIRTMTPFLLLSAGACVLTIITQHEARTGWHGGSPAATLFTMMPVFMHYLRMLVWPFGLSALYDPPLHHSLLEPVVAVSCTALLILLGSAAVLSTRRPRELFWCWFGVLAILPVSQIVPLTTMMNDRYLYFPLVGVAALLFGSLSPIITRNDSLGRAMFCGALFVLLALAILAGQRNLVWKNDLTLWTDAVQKAPGSRSARQGLAETLEARGDLVGAAAHYLEALRKDPGSPELNSQAGVVFAKLKQYPRAVSCLRYAVQLRPANDSYRMNLSAALLESGALEEAIMQLKILYERSPTTRNSCMLGALHEKIGDNSHATVYYGRALQISSTKAADECAAMRSILGLP
ncbi:MAG: hypothetical protein A2X83_07935 [Desulfuromonadales bacterium GWD2_54_10]|nr:MAG: hypothetical protein A2X83_07935 [Desulfuromonadales bacterium GWD2_54_10]